MKIKSIVRKTPLIIALALLVIGVFLRLYKIDFGRPYSFIADETDIFDQVLKYSLNYKNIIPTKNWEAFHPNSYVYGMFPTYFLTFMNMVFNKTASVFDFSISYNSYLIYLRVVTSIVASSLILVTFLIYKRIFGDREGAVLASVIVALNWKLIFHSHYLNQDIYTTVLLSYSILSLILYLQKHKLRCLLISSVFFGLAIGTKITALISVPVIITILATKRDFRGILLYAIVSLTFFSLSNPFSIINFDLFLSRVLEMKSREAGAVLSSVNTNPLKYLSAMSSILSVPATIIFFISIFIVLKRYFKGKKERYLEHILLLGNIFIYLVFFSLNKRLVDRWILPIIPFTVIYISYGIFRLGDIFKSNKYKVVITTISIMSVLSIYIYNGFLIYSQLSQGDTKERAFIWTKKYLKNEKPSVLVYTNKGRDPFYSLKDVDVVLFQVYESKKAFGFHPENPYEYDLVIIYSTMRRNFNNKYVTQNHPEYFKKWSDFISELENSGNFYLISNFKSVKPDLFNVSDIEVYKNISDEDFLANF
jgi:4-amino-4-deoxy-L-arabinose transferase-like glycosyltransferase